MGDEQPVLELELNLHWTDRGSDSEEKIKKKERKGIEKS